MTRHSRSVAVIERIVANLWLCAGLAFLVKFIATDGPAQPVAAHPHMPPGLCETGPNVRPECPSLSSRHLVRNARDDSAMYIVRSASGPGCPFPEDAALAAEANSLTDLDARLKTRCGLALRHSRIDEDNLCFILAQDPCGAYAVSATSVRPCASVVAGPFDALGTRLDAPAEPPFLTVMPALALNNLLLDLHDLKQAVVGPLPHLADWHGTAYAGWLVLSAQRMSVSADRRIAAQTALSRMAAAVAGMAPRPQPVLLDLAGLEVCPDSDQLTAMTTEMESIGIRPFGFYPVSPDLGPEPIRLASGGEERAVLFSLRVRRMEGGAGAACATLPEVAPGAVVQSIRSRLSQELEPRPFTAVFLHWPEATPADDEWTLLVETLLEEGVSVVVGFGSGGAGPVTAAGSGLGIVNAGSAMDERSILPSALIPSGLALRCFAVGSGTACTTIPVAQTLGEPLAVTARDCRGCALLPEHFFDELSGGFRCENGKATYGDAKE